MAIDLLNVDFSVFYQLLLFVLALLVLARWLIAPIVRTLKLRAERTVPVQSDGSLAEEVDTYQNRYTDLLQKSRTESSELRRTLREKALATEAELIADAQQKASAITAEGQRKLEAQVTDVREQMQTWVPEMATRLAAKVIGREL